MRPLPAAPSQHDALTAPAGESRPKKEEERMEVDAGRQQSRSSSTSSDKSQVPSASQMARNLRSLQSEVEDLTEDMSTMRLQMLWTLSEQTKYQRAQAASQVVLQGFQPEHEGPLGDAIRNRDRFIKDLLVRQVRCPEELATFSSSHTMGIDKLSRISIISFANPSMAAALLRHCKGQRLVYGRAQVTCKKQNCLWDRLIGSPAKAAMTIISRYHKHMQNTFTIDWRAGTIYSNHSGTPTLIAEWHTNVEKGRIRFSVAAEYYGIISEGMDEEINRLQFGFLQDTAENNKGKGKSKGKGPKSLRNAAPVDPSAFRRAPEVLKDGLGNLAFGRFPFTIAVRRLRLETKEPHAQAKRSTEGSGPPPKKRTPTPDRHYAHNMAAAATTPTSQNPPLVDAWAQARFSAAAASTAPTDELSRLAAGGTIAA